MIVNDNDALARLLSPNNLVNQIKNGAFNSRKQGMALFGVGEKVNGNNQTAAAPVFKSPFSPGPPTEDIPDSNVSTGTTDNADVSTVRNSEPAVGLGEQLARTTGKEYRVVPVNEPTIDDLLGDADSQIKLTEAHNAALAVVNAALTRVTNDIDTINPNRLPAILTAAQKIVDSVRKEKLEMAKTGNRGTTHHHFYTPTQRHINTFEVIEVGEARNA